MTGRETQPVGACGTQARKRGPGQLCQYSPANHRSHAEPLTGPRNGVKPRIHYALSQ